MILPSFESALRGELNVDFIAFVLTRLFSKNSSVPLTRARMVMLRGVFGSPAPSERRERQPRNDSVNGGENRQGEGLESVGHGCSFEKVIHAEPRRRGVLVETLKAVQWIGHDGRALPGKKLATERRVLPLTA